MSFRCTGCGVAYPNPEHPEERRPTTVVAAARPKRYLGSNSIGWESAGEKKLCTPCVAKHTPPEVDLSQAD